MGQPRFVGHNVVHNFLSGLLKIMHCSGSKAYPKLFRSSSGGMPTRDKVAWLVIIQPRGSGGLDIIDSLCHSQALLGKLVVRGVLSGAVEGFLLPGYNSALPALAALRYPALVGF